MTIRISDAPETKDFINIAETYCRFIYKRNEYTKIEFLQYSYSCLPQLCFCAMNLPDIQRCQYHDRVIAHSIWNDIYKSLQLKLENSNDTYLDVDPYEENAKPLFASLSDDLADIYVDIAQGLRDWPKSDASLRRGIIWEWKFNYETHWGYHATSAFRTIHYLLFSRITDEYKDYIGLKKQTSI